jgi:hypothetical protein
MRTAHQRQWDWRRWNSCWNTIKAGFFGGGEALNKLPPNRQMDRVQQDSRCLTPSLPEISLSKQSHSRTSLVSCCSNSNNRLVPVRELVLCLPRSLTSELDQVGGQQLPRFGIDINVTGGRGRQNQFNQQQQQQQSQDGQQNRFQGQRGFANRGRQYPAAGGLG